MRDASNILLDYDDINDPLAGVTFFDLPNWFTQAGYKKVFDNLIKRVFYHASQRRIVKLNNYVNKGYRVITLIDANMLKVSDDPKDHRNLEESFIPYKGHWIVWEGNVTDLNGNPITENTLPNTLVQLNAFSWGEVKDYIKPVITLKKFLWSTFGALVFKRLN